MYKLTSDKNMIIRGDGANIPIDPRNRDYATYQEWIKAGNIPESMDVVVEPIKTRDEKLQSLLSQVGLTVSDLKEIIGSKIEILGKK